MNPESFMAERCNQPITRAARSLSEPSARYQCVHRNYQREVTLCPRQISKGHRRGSSGFRVFRRLV
jgi:hypothetical protein